MCSCDPAYHDDPLCEQWDPFPPFRVTAVIDSPDDLHLLARYRVAVEAHHTAERAWSVRAMAEADRTRPAPPLRTLAALYLHERDGGPTVTHTFHRTETWTLAQVFDCVQMVLRAGQVPRLTVAVDDAGAPAWLVLAAAPVDTHAAMAPGDPCAELTALAQAIGEYAAPGMACTDGGDDDA